MAKYIITMVLLVLLTMEHNSIYSRIHAKSYKNIDSGTTIAHYFRASEQQNHQPQPSSHQPHQHRHHKRHHHPHELVNPHGTHARQSQTQLLNHRIRHDSHEEEDGAVATRHRYLRLKHQLRQQLEHARLYEERMRSRSNSSRPLALTQSKTIAQNALDKQQKNLKNIPKLWLHLLREDERMYGDSPFDRSESESNEHAANRGTALSVGLREEFEKMETPNHEAVTQEKPPKEEQPTPVQCPKCETNRHVEHVTEEELTQLRIEFVKQQILEKLRLKERPKVSPVRLPKPIYEGTTIEEEDEKSLSKELDDYYARTSKKFIFLQREQRECKRLDNHPSMCFSFKIDDADADSFDVNTAVLWLFKNKQSKTRRRNSTMLAQETIVVSELQQSPDTKYIPISKTIAIQSVDVQDEWLKIDIEWPIKRWFGNHELSHLIQISCQSCNIESMDEMISVDKDYRPFIMIDMQNRRRQPRQKRSINCTDGVTECCREKLYISFDEIGWGDWIILPRGYDAYFCRGSCGTVASVAQSSSHHSAFLQKVSSSRRANGRKPLELVPCCTAKQYSSLQIVFMDSNNTATQKTFPNMVVESCGCR